MAAYHCHIFRFLLNNPSFRHEIMFKTVANSGRFIELTSISVKKQESKKSAL
jgi:hypothetical protein